VALTVGSETLKEDLPAIRRDPHAKAGACCISHSVVPILGPELSDRYVGQDSSESTWHLVLFPSGSQGRIRGEKNHALPRIRL